VNLLEHDEVVLVEVGDRRDKLVPAGWLCKDLLDCLPDLLRVFILNELYFILNELRRLLLLVDYFQMYFFLFRLFTAHTSRRLAFRIALLSLALVFLGEYAAVVVDRLLVQLLLALLERRFLPLLYGLVNCLVVFWTRSGH
jgi:hypothetical protein